MPLPKTQGEEKKSNFMSRCISDSDMGKEFKDIKQRIAVCLTLYKGKKSKKTWQKVIYYTELEKK